MSVPNDAAGEAPRRSLKTVVLSLAVLVALATWVWWQGSEQRALHNLPAAERAALYERTLANVQTVCASSDPALDGYCREQARILLELPECDEPCRALGRTQVGRRGP
jgi:hypothetical protein